MTTETQAPDPAQALLVQALEDIIEPFAYIERTLPEGYRLDGCAALQQINSREFYARIAKEALAAYRARAIPAPEGAPGDMVLVPRELIKDAAESVDDYRCSLEFGAHDRKLLGRLKAALAAPAPDENSGSAEEYHKALAAPAPQAPVALTDYQIVRIHEQPELAGARHESFTAKTIAMVRAAIAEFCRVNGIPAPQTKELTNDR